MITKFKPIVTELPSDEKTKTNIELNISHDFIAKYNFKVPKDVRLNRTWFFIMKV